MQWGNPSASTNPFICTCPPLAWLPLLPYNLIYCNSCWHRGVFVFSPCDVSDQNWALVRQSVGDGSHYFRSISRLFTRENLPKGPLSNSPMSGNITLARTKCSREESFQSSWHNPNNMKLTSTIKSGFQPKKINVAQIPKFTLDFRKGLVLKINIWISDKGGEEKPFVFSIKYRIV